MAIDPINSYGITPASALQTFRLTLQRQQDVQEARDGDKAVPYSVGREVLNRALQAGATVRSFLDKLKSTVFQADMQGRVRDDAFSRYSRQGEVVQMLRGIENAVAAAEYEDINLVSSRGRAYRYQTSRFGGAFAIEPQPMDVTGLGLRQLSAQPLDISALKLKDLGIVSDISVKDALERIEQAITLVDDRFNRLQQADELFGFGQSFLSRINGGGADEFSNQSTTLPRGSLVDFLA